MFSAEPHFISTPACLRHRPLPAPLPSPHHLAPAILQGVTLPKWTVVFLTSWLCRFCSLYLACTPIVFTCLFNLQGPWKP